ncbi:MAG: glycerol-3-phosphate dehydrogenase [Propionibacteriaceae bacterium]|jgi:glycerol-3-phosphate dehydrogenase (NAD(P)+)|nr:glycerol-3-phosphate dehydrogenase [Propionibacteriaceae bacterium]
MIITILGAGAMGSALATPLTEAGHEVRLWGTWLDDHLIAAIRAGKPHPRTNVAVPRAAASYAATELADAMADAQLAVIAVSSVGVEGVSSLAAEYLSKLDAIAITSKGFAPDKEGRIQLLPQTVERALAEKGLPCPPVVAIGGPCKANEVAAGQPTATIYGNAKLGVAAKVAAAATTGVYRVSTTTDRDGLELCAALKNVLAIALGIADGLTDTHEIPFHDLKAAVFAEGLAELRLILEAEGADPWTAFGLAGAGDLEVTGLSGRNKVYGARIGAGQEAKQALAEMVAAEQTVEGVDAARLVRTFISQRHPELVEKLSLLDAIYKVVHEGAGLPQLVDAALGGKP